MAVAHVSEFDAQGDERQTTVYDAVTQRLGAADDPPPGLIVHSAGFTDSGAFRIFDVWESREQAESFYNDRLGPIVESVLAEADEPGNPPSNYFYELHNLIAP